MTTDAYRGWDSETRFRRLLDELVPLDPGGWRLPDVRTALSTPGWEIRPVVPGGSPPDLARGPRPEVAWELGHHPRGPRQGVGVLTVAAEDPEQVLGLEVNLSYGIAYDDDHAHELHFAQTAREVAEDVLGGPPTRLSGPGSRAVWRRPGTSVAIAVDEGCVVLQLLCTDQGAEFRRGRPDQWRAAARADLSAPEPERPVRDREELRERLGEALAALCAEVHTFPGDFTLRLSSLRDPLRSVVAVGKGWDDALRLQAPAGGPGLPGADRLTASGWQHGDGVRQHTVLAALAMGDRSRGPAREAAALLVDALRALEVDLADLAYSGEVEVPKGARHLELPHLGIPRAAPEPEEAAGAGAGA
ncbi:hypothetical protein ACF058_14915 [Streptomyces sp. NPDC015501]|uniref:hypothetical protein n=1 Tax=unclassified Streptomyces TaxID=2593676 RepID=UPI00128880FB|nr:hypothetical protein A3L22_16770 [Streptomyces griseus subsp. griseus]